MVNKKSTIKNFWIIFFACLALLAIGYSVFATYYADRELGRVRSSTISDENVYKISQENAYRQSLYAVCDGIKNLDANLTKAAVSTDAQMQAESLTKAVICANAALQNLSILPIELSDRLVACQKFVNQSQDYATYLIGSLSGGNALTDAQIADLVRLDGVAVNLCTFLQNYAKSDSGMFMTNGNGKDGVGSLSREFGKLDNRAFQYDKLLYDGPFSDSVLHAKVRSSADLGVKTCGKIVGEHFGEGVFVGKSEANGGCYLFEVDGGNVQITVGGKVLQYTASSVAGVDEAKELSAEDAAAHAQRFCAELGYDVVGVWTSISQNGCTYVSCVSVDADGTLLYPQMIKVAVDGYGKVVGMDAKAYLANSSMSAPVFGAVTQEQAAKGLVKGTAITDYTKCVLSKNGMLHAAWQIHCSMYGNEYYVFVDSISGKQLDVFKVVNDADGHTVI